MADRRLRWFHGVG